MLVLAHRADHESGFPQNSMAAIASARDRGLDGVEVDVRLSADDQLVLCHDAHLGGGIAVRDLSRTRIDDLLGHPVAELGAALRSAPELFWNIEIKDRAAVPSVRRLLAEASDVRRVLVSSFDHAAALACTADTPFDTGFLIAHLPLDAATLPAPPRPHAQLIWDFEFCSAAMLAAARGRGWRNSAYGVASPTELSSLDPEVFHAVITDFTSKFAGHEGDGDGPDGVVARPRQGTGRSG